MRIFRVLCVAWVMSVAAGAARADGPAVPASETTAAPSQPSVALATNLPFLWAGGDTFAASLYVGISGRHVIRANFASYKNHANSVGNLISALAGGDDLPSSIGRTTDVGIGWVYYAEHAWRGVMYEVGVLRRARDVGTYDSNATFELVNTKTTVYAAHVMIGWSWLMYEAVFVATGVGVSVGRESGTGVAQSYSREMTTRTSIARADTNAEAYLRVGFVLGR